MEEHASLTSLIVVLVAAFITPILLKKFRLTIIPVVVAEIIVGLIIGKSGFNLVHPEPWLETLSVLGFIFLMFLSGLEIDFSVFVNNKKKKQLPNGKLEPNGFFVGTVVFIFIFIISYLISLLLVFWGYTENAFFMTLVISTISLGVVVPTLKDAEIMNSGIGQIILIVAVVADLATMILLAVFVSFYEGGGNMWLLLLLFVAGIGLYFIGKFFKQQTFFETLSTGTIQIGTRAVFTLIILLVGLSETLGAENILGAFLAGVLVSLLSPNKEMVKQLDSFGYGFLIPIFFVMVGVELNIWELFQDSSILFLIPILFIGLLVSKLIPVIVLKRWYDWRTVIGSGLLLTSTLSLVVAAAKVGERIGVIGERMSSALILLAVVTCIITPVLFKKVFPFKHVKEGKKKVAIIGANQLSLPLSKELDLDEFDIRVYHYDRAGLEDEKTEGSEFTVTYLENYKKESLLEGDVFKADIFVAATSDDQQNIELVELALEEEVENIIVRMENPEIGERLKSKGVNTVSSFFSTKAMMKAMIESPNVASLFTTKEEGLSEIYLHNGKYDGVKLRHFPFLGDTIIVRIFRGNESLVPHGDTELKLGDRLIVTGSSGSVYELKNVLR